MFAETVAFPAGLLFARRFSYAIPQQRKRLFAELNGFDTAQPSILGIDTRPQ